MIDFKIDAEGRLGGIERANDDVFFEYDGRGFLRRAGDQVIFVDGYESGDLSCWSATSTVRSSRTCPTPVVLRSKS